ncbi:UDP-N-acetylmuramate--alanine ligase [Microbacterium sp. Leaf347]|uniref:gamma-glutamylcyclotransferase family protein n=1 Tax=unclassified Microbacterium TaxID=2609290 RepID=UPI0006F889B1|nr:MULTISPECIES: gamma-glutamylcyclotransferase family protein [unclassified Microbacterium]KQR90658.1 UDP-N-acetylmuramate--alanine ligase [Microbacterium sp. Leaf351]KQR96852.1 UDP-N-acetylmuramate--alanine ligase [Microbacterium sp. Leaf347]
MGEASVVGDIVFSYGTLQQRGVQLEVFGRAPDGEPDLLPGYTVDYLEVLDTRGRGSARVSVHPVVRPTGSLGDKVTGLAYALTPAEVDAADEYESPLYRRVPARLSSGRTAWVYVSA